MFCLQTARRGALPLAMLALRTFVAVFASAGAGRAEAQPGKAVLPITVKPVKDGVEVVTYTGTDDALKPGDVIIRVSTPLLPNTQIIPISQANLDAEAVAKKDKDNVIALYRTRPSAPAKWVHVSLLAAPATAGTKPGGSVQQQALDLKYVSTFKWVSDDSGRGAIFNGAHYQPVDIPAGYHVLGHMMFGPASLPARNPKGSSEEANRRAVLVAKDLVPGALKAPVNFIAAVDTSDAKGPNDVTVWHPVPPPGYRTLGDVFTWGTAVPGTKPALTSVMCVRNDLCAPAKLGKLLYSSKGNEGWHHWSVFEVVSSGIEGQQGLNIGATRVIEDDVRGEGGELQDNAAKMIARDPKKTGPLYTLAAAKVKPAAGLSKTDVDEIIAKFGPVLHLHSREAYFPTQVNLDEWTVQDAAKKTLDARDPKTYLGNLANSKAYVWVKQVHPSFTDLQFWFFYGFNGTTFVEADAWLKGGFTILTVGKRDFSLSLDNMNSGKHIGDWEHITLRVDNKTKRLAAVGYTSHGDTVWYKPISNSPTDQHIKAFSALHMHGNYPFPGSNPELFAWKEGTVWGGGGAELKLFSRNICAEGGQRLEAYKPGKYEIVESDSFPVQRPEWLSKYPAPWRWGREIEVVDKVVLKFPKPIGNKEIEIKKGKEEGPTTASYLYE